MCYHYSNAYKDRRRSYQSSYHWKEPKVISIVTQLSFTIIDIGGIKS